MQFPVSKRTLFDVISLIFQIKILENADARENFWLFSVTVFRPLKLFMPEAAFPKWLVFK